MQRYVAKTMRNLLSRILPAKAEEADSDSTPPASGPHVLEGMLPVPATSLRRLSRPEARIRRLYEDPSLFEGQENRADTDRVVAYLTATGSLLPGPLVRARRLWRTMGRKEPLWRVLLRGGEISQELVLEAAAVSYGFAPVEVSLLETVGLIDHLAAQWPESVLPRLIGLGILPVVPSRERKQPATTFAASDPTRPEVRRMVETVAEGTHSIRYLSPQGMAACIQAVSDFLPDVLPSSIRAIHRGKTGSTQDGQTPARVSRAA